MADPGAQVRPNTAPWSTSYSLPCGNWGLRVGGGLAIVMGQEGEHKNLLGFNNSFYSL